MLVSMATKNTVFPVSVRTEVLRKYTVMLHISSPFLYIYQLQTCSLIHCTNIVNKLPLPLLEIIAPFSLYSSDIPRCFMAMTFKEISR